MADEDLRAGLQQTIDHNPQKVLYGEFALDATNGDSTLFTIPDNFQVVDCYVDITVAAATTAQTLALQINDGADDVILGSIVGTSAGLTRMTTGVQTISDAAGTIEIARTATDADTGATVRVMIIGYRANQ